MHVFYTPDIALTGELPEEESRHCSKVLRLDVGEEIMLTDGCGNFHRATLATTGKRCLVNIIETTPQPPLWQGRLHLAMAPTKNMDRTEWAVEKAVEIGIDAISFLDCRYSERRRLKLERIEKIMVSAMKQSLKARLPQVSELMPFDQFIAQNTGGRRFIAHCYAEPKPLLRDVVRRGEDALVLIGPEGDFSREEVDKAVAAGYEPVSLSNSRLRTETAALLACMVINNVNQ